MIEKIKTRIAAMAINRWDRDVPLSPDGERYWFMGGGDTVCRPFHYRWLIPALCKQSRLRWRACAELSTALLIPAAILMLLVYGVPLYAAVGGGLCVFGLSGVWRFNRDVPVLVDAPAMLLVVISVTFIHLPYYFWPIAVIAILVAGCVKETSPVFAAAIAWNPLLLIGLIAPLIRKLRIAEGEDVVFNPDAIHAIYHPYDAGMKSHSHMWTDWKIMLAPWGGLVLASLHLSFPLMATLLLAYGTLVIATDTIRLYQWAWPAVLIAAFSLPPVFWGPIILLTLFNPYKGSGA